MIIEAVRTASRFALPAMAAMLAASVSTGCQRKVHDLTTVRGAYAAYVEVAESGRYEEMFPLLVPELQQQIATTHANLRTTRELIERYYPPELKRQALADIGPEKVRLAATPAAYFAARVDESHRYALSLGEKLGSLIKRIDEIPKDSGRFQVVTVSGAKLDFYKGPTRVSVVLSKDDIEGILRESRRSAEMLANVQSLVKTLSGGSHR